MSRQFILEMLNAFSRRLLSFWTSIIEMSRSITCRRPNTASSISSSESAGSSTLTPEPVRRKKALVIGINYSEGDGPSNPLKKSHADCEKVKSLLLELHYTEERITMMMDAPSVSEDLQPTYNNIRTQFSLLIKDALPGDHFCLFFTGHGWHEEEGEEGLPPKQETLAGYTQRAENIPSAEGDSSKGYLVPCDSTWKKDDVIHVKDIRELLIDKLPNDTTLISVIDCCNGGALMGLPYKWSGMGCLEPCLFDQCHVSSGHKPQPITGHQPGRALCISGCGDRETTYEHEVYGGLLVEALLEGYYNKKDITFHELFMEVDKRYGKFRKEYQERTGKPGEDFPTFEISSSQPWLFPDSVRRDSKRFLWMNMKFSCKGLGEGENT